MAFSRLTIKYGGQFNEFDITDMDIPLDGASDQQVLNATRQKLEDAGIAVSKFNGFVVDPPEGQRLSGQHDDKSAVGEKSITSVSAMEQGSMCVYGS